eukprot:jgi/Undpi1/11735/HiC_scaffold_37.g14030.m1
MQRLLGRRAVARTPDAAGKPAGEVGLGRGRDCDSRQMAGDCAPPGIGQSRPGSLRSRRGKIDCVDLGSVAWTTPEAGRRLAMTGEQGSPCLQGRRDSTTDVWSPPSQCDVVGCNVVCVMRRSEAARRRGAAERERAGDALTNQTASNLGSIDMKRLSVAFLLYVLFGCAAEGEKTSREGLSASGHDVTPLSDERVAELAASLAAEVRYVTQAEGTERAGSGAYLKNKAPGTYCCVVCGLPLFDAKTKFASRSGWPSFWQPIDSMHVRDVDDGARVESECARCGSHLGHVFDDGFDFDKRRPTETGLRYCMNSVALQFFPDDRELPLRSRPVK